MLHVTWHADDHRYPFLQNLLCLESNEPNKLTFYSISHSPIYLPTLLLLTYT